MLFSAELVHELKKYRIENYLPCLNPLTTIPISYLDFAFLGFILINDVLISKYVNVIFLSLSFRKS